ncbi:MAG: SDR family oxidoreductase [Gemmatimonadales bacterium]|jgi:NAD(P)-dependent dehydrogenase (short-subunit alcohol dehydrogenase family)|nr:SDR family oxidoreductase [Gemmatimonadales bacterium]
MSPTRRIAGRVALVTGATRGIGRGLVQALLARGARTVYAGGRRAADLADLVTTYGTRVVPLALDVTNGVHVRQAVDLADDTDLLVNNAGVALHGFAPFEDPAWLDAARAEYEVNVIGVLRLTQAFAPILAHRGGGVVVNVNSISGLVGMPQAMTYHASKAALHSLTQSTRMALRGQGTEVIGVYPGPTDTEMAKRLPNIKATVATVANAILDGIEQGVEEIFPDPFAQQIGAAYLANPKELERTAESMQRQG